MQLCKPTRGIRRVRASERATYIVDVSQRKWRDLGFLQQGHWVKHFCSLKCLLAKTSSVGDVSRKALLTLSHCWRQSSSWFYHLPPSIYRWAKLRSREVSKRQTCTMHFSKAFAACTSHSFSLAKNVLDIWGRATSMARAQSHRLQKAQPPGLQPTKCP